MNTAAGAEFDFDQYTMVLDPVRFHYHKRASIMSTFIMLTRLNPDAAKFPAKMEDLERKVVDRISADCPDVKWLGSYAVLGPYDYLDIFSAPDNESALRVSVLIRTFGHAHTEVWPATEWKRFKDIVHTLPDTP